MRKDAEPVGFDDAIREIVFLEEMVDVHSKRLRFLRGLVKEQMIRNSRSSYQLPAPGKIYQASLAAMPILMVNREELAARVFEFLRETAQLGTGEPLPPTSEAVLGSFSGFVARGVTGKHIRDEGVGLINGVEKALTDKFGRRELAVSVIETAKPAKRADDPVTPTVLDLT